MPRHVQCPFCKGFGRIEADGPPRLPKGWVTLPVLAAQAGLSHSTVHKHLVDDLLHGEWAEYRRGRGNRKVRAYLVSPAEQERYKAWVGAKGGRRLRHRTIEYVRMLEAGEHPEVIAQRLGIKKESVQRFASRLRKRGARLD
jgi:DNA-binding IclR family transcriptional regulator